MFRKDLIPLLLDNPLRLSEIARLYDVPLKEVLDDVKHLRKTLKQSAYRLDVTASRMPQMQLPLLHRETLKAK